MKTKWKIGIWGQSGGGGKIADGQAVRTTIIKEELINRYGEEQIGFADTFEWKKRVLAFLRDSIRIVAKSQNVIILPADNGFKVFAPMIVILNKLFRRKLIYIVIGGFLPELLRKQPFYKIIVNQFDILFVQTASLKKDLEKIGIKNIHILSNLKRLNTLKPEDIHLRTEQDVKVCVFSRINQEKGIEDAIEAVKIANQKLKGRFIKIDLYGLLPDSYKERFSQLMIENGDIAEYKGIVYYNKTVETLRDYFALLFPTYYYGEGFPGNVVDAYNSGLPIIATDWLYNSDVIKDGRNGLLVPIKDPNAISEALLKLYENRNLVMEISLNNLSDSLNYHPDKVMAELYDFIDGKV